jgi:Ycf66 protein N-terminus
MLAYILAVLVGTGSVGLYISAFFFPEIHRKHDFIWSGVGCFYALALWIYARQETGGILVGQIASVSLLGWFGWQTIKLRRQLVPVNQQTPMPSTTKLQNRSSQKQSVRDANQPPADRQNVPAQTINAAKPTATKTSSPSERPPTSASKNTPAGNPTPQPSNPAATRPIVTVTSEPSTNPNERPPATAKTTPVVSSTQQPSNPTPTTTKPAAPVASEPSNNNAAERPPAIAKTAPVVNPTPPPSNPTPTPAKPAATATPDPQTNPGRPPANAKTAPLERNLPPNADRSNPSANSVPAQGSDPVTPVEERAWIEIQVRPTAATSKPLGNPAQPPAAPPTPGKSSTSVPPEIVPDETISAQNVPLDAIQTTAKVEEESQNWD